MSLPGAQMTVRSLPMAVVVIAAWLALVKSIEKANHRYQFNYWTRQENQWRDAYSEAIGQRQPPITTMYANLAAECREQKDYHRSQLAGSLPCTFSTESAILTLLYWWAVTLYLVVRAERSAQVRAVIPGSSARDAAILRSFPVWVALALISPIVVMALGVTFERRTPDRGTRPWPASTIEALFWLQVMHALLGIIYLRGRRWAALGVGVFSVLATGWIAFHCLMAVTGVWL
jgi:hypothetical protein